VRYELLAVGRTQASRVIPEVRSRELLSMTSIRSFVPSKLAAAPNFEVVDHVAPLISVPLLPLPDLSAAVVPAPSSKEYAATNPELCANATGAESSAAIASAMISAICRKFWKPLRAASIGFLLIKDNEVFMDSGYAPRRQKPTPGVVLKMMFGQRSRTSTGQSPASCGQPHFHAAASSK